MNTNLTYICRRVLSAKVANGYFRSQQAQSLWLNQSGIIRCLTTTSTNSEAAKTGEDFFKKNERLGRPISPHMSILLSNPQLTSMLSITHRGTGLAMSALISTFAIGMLASSSSFASVLAALESAHYGSGVIFAVKYILAFPFFFHTFNGVRHLAWDMGKGFQISQVYATGYGVLALSIISSIIAAVM